ncbi:hypothetical protein AYO38_09535 [bacterium SCGC AG-212-C10]|nr:hypothetical protein AYO38_09535 [bacterium SCGC AG-212-C10]
MTSRWPFVLPILALIVAVASVGGAIVITNSRTDSKPAPDVETKRSATPENPPEARLSNDVCDFVLNPPAPGQERVFSPHYTQKREVMGIAIVGDERVDAEAFDVAEATIKTMFAGNGLAEPLAEAQAYVVIADSTEGVLDLPEFGCLGESIGEDFFSHVCGVADRADYPVATVNELDLMGDRDGPCDGLNILFHELGHLVQGWSVSPPDYFDIKLLYQDALNANKYRRAYAATNPNEYFAEATQAYFLSVDRAGRQDRDWLKSYDPDIYAMLQRLYGE